MTALEPAITVDEAARRLGMHPESVRRMCRAGRVPAAKFGRVWRIDPARLSAMFAGRQRGDRWGAS